MPGDVSILGKYKSWKKEVGAELMEVGNCTYALDTRASSHDFTENMHKLEADNWKFTSSSGG